jgi:O-antigen ligase
VGFDHGRPGHGMTGAVGHRRVEEPPTPTLLERFVGPGIAPNYWMLAFCVLIPLQSVYLNKVPKIPGTGLNLLNILILGSLFVLRRRPELRWTESPQMKRVIIAFFVWWAFSILVSLHTLGYLVPYTVSNLKDMFIPYLMYFVVYHSVKDKRGVKLTLIATMLPLPIMFHVFRGQVSGMMGGSYNDDWKGNIKGTFPELGSNEIAAFYGTYTLVLISLLAVVKEFRWKLALWALIGTNIFCLLFAFSRGEYVAFLLGIGILGLLLNPKKSFVIGFLVVLFAVPLYNALPDVVQERFGSIFVGQDQMDDSALQRYVMWQIAFDLFKGSPLYGIGYHAFIKLNPHGMDTHNFFMKALTEQGIIGAIVVLSLLIRAMTVAVSLYRKTRDPLFRALSAGVISCLFAIIAGNFFGDRFSHYALIAYFWVYLALLEVGLQLHASEAPPEPGKSRLRKLRT